MNLRDIERRDPGLIVVFAVLTCGLYLLYWYWKVYDDIETLTGSTPTGRSYGVDLLLTIVTCTLYGVWVDQRISTSLQECAAGHGMPTVRDTTMVVLILDLAAFATSFLTNFVSSAIHQDQLNRLVRYLEEPRSAPRSGAPGWGASQQP